MLLCSSSFWSRDAPAWMGRNEDSLLRAAGESMLASATRGGSCAHPDQSRGLVQRHNMRAISGVGASSPILLFFLGGGVALHERLVGTGDRHRGGYQLGAHPSDAATHPTSGLSQLI